jgi:hypothetical protein
MKYIAIIAVLVLVGCKETQPTRSPDRYVPLSYQQLVDYPRDCAKSGSQLAELKSLQDFKKFPSDPDQMDPNDRAYNGRLKATIWWYSYSCGESA